MKTESVKIHTAKGQTISLLPEVIETLKAAHFGIKHGIQSTGRTTVYPGCFDKPPQTDRNSKSF